MNRMECNEVLDLIQAYEDGELPASERIAVAGHMQTCAECAKALTGLQRLRATIRSSGTFAAPAGLEGRVRTAIGIEDQRRPELKWRGFAKLAASHVAAVALGSAIAYAAFARSDAHTAVTRDVVTAHVRSLIGDQLVHIASADTHTVKPWFVGKIPFSPVVMDLAAKEFPLVGGRLDYVLDRPTATLVYGRRKHRINLFIQSVDPSGGGGEFRASRNGFNLVSWSSGGFSNFATSDLNMAELEEFARELRSNRDP